MNSTAFFLSYRQTGYFSKIVLDYLEKAPSIQPFYLHPVSNEGILAAITELKKFDVDRKLLVTVLQEQYAAIELSAAVAKNIKLLKEENSFTVCTAHQPNIFTGPLFFIYKILHAVKLAEQLNEQLPENNFIPVYYMGSEDADLEELGHIYIGGEKYSWNTHQTGAVGRMKVDDALVDLIDKLSGQLLVLPYGADVITLMKSCYQPGATIEHATFQMVSALFAEYGLIIILPDNANLKAAFIPVIERELNGEFSHQLVEETVAKFPAEYKVQASGRALNMFYLIEGKRERIEVKNGEWTVLNTGLKFTKEQILAELQHYPERFSPNVILRPLFQEWILPNVVFIGGGGEIAYWLQLKKVFEAAEVPYPLLVLRNSFLFATEEIQAQIDKLKLGHADLFKDEQALINDLVKKESSLQLSLENEMGQLSAFYDHLKNIAGNVDNTLKQHTAALQTQALKKVAVLEKKMLRAEKRKFEAEQRQIQKIKSELFPNNNLQERMDNGMLYYARWGKDFFNMIYTHSKGLEQQFSILTESTIARGSEEGAPVQPVWSMNSTGES